MQGTWILAGFSIKRYEGKIKITSEMASETTVYSQAQLCEVYCPKQTSSENVI